MWFKLVTAVCLVTLVIDNHRSFVDTAPLDSHNGKEPKKDEEVKELENLKKIFGNPSDVGKEVSIGKVYTNVNGRKTSHGELKEEVTKNGKILAKVSEKLDMTQERGAEPKAQSKTVLDIPSKGIHRTVIKESNGNVEVTDGQDFSNNGQRRSDTVQNGIEKINSYAGLEYTPLDMAEYIFWTGDEKGVIMAIEEFLEEGLMSREEAIAFLQSIKTNLDYMQEHYHGLQKTETRITSNGRSNIRDRLTDLEKFDYDLPQEMEKMKSESYDETKYEAVKSPDAYDQQTRMQMSRYENPLKVKSVPSAYSERRKRFKEDVAKSTGANGVTLSDEDFEELVERLRVADFLYSEYSLEEVIYQLAKVVFSQSLMRGSAEAQMALQRFTSFLEKEARMGQISRSLEKKIIDLLIAALSDTLTEHPQLLSAVRENLSDADLPNLSGSVAMKNQLQGSDGASRTGGITIGKSGLKATSNMMGNAPTSKN